MNLPATPPNWMKDYPTAKNAWRRCVLFEDKLPKRELNLLSSYVEAVNTAISSFDLRDDVSHKIQSLTRRSVRAFYTKSKFQSELLEGLDTAQRINDASAHLRQSILVLEKELLDSLNQTSPALRALALAILPIGKSLLRKKETSSRSITIKR